MLSTVLKKHYSLKQSILYWLCFPNDSIKTVKTKTALTLTQNMYLKFIGKKITMYVE